VEDKSEGGENEKDCCVMGGGGRWAVLGGAQEGRYR